VLDLEQAPARETAERIVEGGGEALALEADISLAPSLETAVEVLVKRWGRIDVVVNNAGILTGLDPTDASLEYIKRVQDVNLFGGLNAVRAVLPFMKEQGAGSIVNIASLNAYPASLAPGGEEFDGVPTGYAYGLSKAGVIYTTQAMARVLGQFRIRVNAIAPGGVLTEATRSMLTQVGADRLNRNASLPGPIETTDIAGTAAYLASEDSAGMTGQTLVVDLGHVFLG